MFKEYIFEITKKLRLHVSFLTFKPDFAGQMNMSFSCDMLHFGLEFIMFYMQISLIKEEGEILR